MSYSATIKMVSEDDLPAITYKIKDQNNPADGQELDARDPDTWATVNLTGYTARVDIRVKGAVEVLETLSLSIINATEGAVLLDIVDSEFKKNPGQYELESVIADAGSAQQTVYDLMLVKVRSRVKVTAA